MDEAIRIQAMAFVEERVSAWELKHGLVTDEGRECLKALVWASLNASPRVIARLAETGPPPGHEGCKSSCFCERKNQDES